MSLQFILGTGEKNHQKVLIEEAEAWTASHPLNEVYFLVPNYNKFEQEKNLLSLLRQAQQSEILSTTRTQVFSFRRLAWFFLQQEATFTNSNLSDAGAAMIFRKILLESMEELTVFRGEVNKTGFIQQLYDLYKELQDGQISIAEFSQLLAENQAGNEQQLKLQDLALIFQRFEEALIANDLQTNRTIEELATYLATRDLKHIRFIVTGFSRFSAREIHLLIVLMSQAQLQVSLILDKPYINEQPSSLNLFYESGLIYYKLYHYAKQNQLEILFDKKAEKSDSELPELAALRNYWEASQSQQSFNKAKLENPAGLHLIKAENPKEEIACVARKIRRLVAKEGLRYQEIQLLVRDMTVYQDLIPAIFKQHEIPFYLDQSLSMEQHPLVEFLNALFAIKNNYYRLRDIMRFFRTELFFPGVKADDLALWQRERDAFRNKVDITENICLANNFQGHFWQQDKTWQIYHYDFEKEELANTTDLQEIANEVRQSFNHVVPQFFEKLATVETGQQAAECLYIFLQTAGVENQLLAWRQQEIMQGNLANARNHEQTWNALMNLLDEYVMIYGETAFDWEVFQEIIKTGLANLDYGMIPTALDQVNINQLELATPKQSQVTFAIGLNDQVFPQKIEARSLLTAEEKSFLNERLTENKYLVDETLQGMSKEPFSAYLVFLSAEKTLYLSYAANVDTKKDLIMSPYLQQIQKNLGIELETVNSLDLSSDSSERVSTYRSLLGDINIIHRLAADSQQLLPKSWLYFEKLLKNSQYSELVSQVLASLDHLNVPSSLDSQLIQELYGKNLYVSVSRLESFYNCSYKYFATYGLKLQEREIYGLTPAATGDFYHEALDRFFKVLIANNLTLVDLSEAKRKELTEIVLQEILGEVRFEVLNRTARMNYIRYQLSQTIQKVSWALKEQSQRTGLAPLQTEVLFSQIATKKGLSSLSFDLDNGGQLHVRGKIDRVDVAEKNQELWLSVVDYKSSARSFDVSEAYYGLAMQLLTYLDVALTEAVTLTGSQNVRPAGAYYLQIQNPVLTSADNIERDTLKKFSYDGFFVDNPESFELLDHTLEAKENSLLFPIRKDAKDTYQKVGVSKNKFYSEDELALLTMHNRQNMQKAGNQILSGEVALNPAYKDKQRIACQYCPFRSVCEFDVMLKENQYHRLEKMNRERVLEKLEGGCQAND
ncbi:ATP-dependent helicase/nuclease subunit B [Enterococcus sp. PF1-24]|uniref:PD-(D/E)XK nuclease family protein n=1 Tax=unclassified Enterococcus TaxID=2608891 RepID=UPI00247518E5|nr:MULTISPECIES: PD-(D/E)XK nuclease family protein [unclassified Enterococcus]MDH6365010.1 ATP-dependent helicase/nuclease subunit B [Enterococcus sp. PFB1-1]MDH6402111.1 ATP-dependent helicase/nuclease subunit B [Enterococcus sp. PF1-24]